MLVVGLRRSHALHFAASRFSTFRARLPHMGLTGRVSRCCTLTLRTRVPELLVPVSYRVRARVESSARDPRFPAVAESSEQQTPFIRLSSWPQATLTGARVLEGFVTGAVGFTPKVEGFGRIFAANPGIISRKN
jgi:hypothetical protein